MTTPIERFITTIKDKVGRLNDEAKYVTRVGIIGIAGLSVASCGVQVKDDFNARLEVIDAATSDNLDAADINPTDINRMDINSTDMPMIDVVQPPVDTITDVQASDAPIEVLTALDSIVDIGETGDSTTSDAGTLTDVVSVTDTIDVNDVLPTDISPSDLGIIDASTDNGFDANDIADASTSDISDDVRGAEIGDSSIDIPSADTVDSSTITDTADVADIIDVATDRLTDTGIDASVGTRFVTGPTPTGLASCNRVIVIGILGCNPDSVSCEYNTNVGGPLRYYVDTVTTSAGYPLPYSYGFSSFLGDPLSRSFTIPDTGNFTPTFTSGVHTVQVNLVSGPALVTRCYGPTIRIVTR